MDFNIYFPAIELVRLMICISRYVRKLEKSKNNYFFQKILGKNRKEVILSYLPSYANLGINRTCNYWVRTPFYGRLHPIITKYCRVLLSIKYSLSSRELLE